MKDSARAIAFAAVLGIVCAAILAGATIYTAPFRAANEKAEELRNLLAVLGAASEEVKDSQALVALFERDVRTVTLGDLTAYEYRPTAGSGASLAVAIRFGGMGLWGEIEGVIALEPDLRTIRGISFYKQDETPGLGGEIGAVWFRQQFVDKKLVSEAGVPGFRVLRPGSTPGQNEVDGISGASLTGARVELIIAELARSIEKERQSYVR